VGFELNWPTRAAIALLLGLCFAVTSTAAERDAHAGHGKGGGGSGSAGKSALGVVSLDVYADGAKLHLLTAERVTAGRPPEMRYQRSDDGGATWNAPVPVGAGQPTPDPAHRGLDAQIAASGDKLVAIWTTGAETRFGRGPLATAISDDGGKTWHAGPNPADDGLATDHAFAEIAADDAGNLHAVWLDGRARGVDAIKASASPDSKASGRGRGAGSGAGGAPTSAGKGLRYARSIDGGRTWSANVTLDAQCCECCWNSLLALPGGVVHVLYRDRDPRDMSLISSSDGGKTWGKPSPVGAFNWAFDGCPHVGGALAATGADRKSLVATVWTAKGADALGVFAVALNDSTDSNSPSTPMQLGGPQSSRPDITTDAQGTVVATWDAYVEDADHPGNRAFAAKSLDGGKTWSKPIALSAAGASATYPRVVSTGTGFRAFWTEQSPGKPVRWTSHVIP
jgi:hypothetical protein